MPGTRGISDHLVRLELLAWVALSAATYAALHPVQRRLFLNGLTDDPFTFPRFTADLVTAQRDVSTYWALTAVLLLGYGWLLLRGRHWGRWAVAAAVAGSVVLVVARPSLSIDLLSYLSHGYLAATGLNPYLTASSDVAGLPYGALLAAEGWTPVHGPTPYGPVWTHVEQLAYRAAPDRVPVGLAMLKAVTLAATLVSGWLIGRIAETIRTGTGRTAALAWLANPLVVSEFAADGHNDAVAICFALLALWLALTGRLAVLAVIALGLGVLVKYTPLIFALPLLVLLVRRRRVGWARLLGEIGAGSAAVAAVGWLLWRPWWSGRDTFAGLQASGTAIPSPSPAGWLAEVFVAPLDGTADPRGGLILAGLLALTILLASWFRPRPRAAAGWAVIAVVALAVLPVYWPWYAGLAVAVLLLNPTAVGLGQAFLLTAGSRIAGPYGNLGALGLVDFPTMFARDALWGITLPVAGCLLLAATAAVRLRRERDGREISSTPLYRRPNG